MGLDEDPRNPNGHGRPGQHRHELALPARNRALTPRLLHRMGGIEDYRRTRSLQDRQGAKIGDERVVAERNPALGDEHVAISRSGDLRHHVGHVPRREKLALLDIDRPPGLRRRDEEVGLPAQKCRDLQDVDRFRGVRALGRLVHIGEHGNAELVSDLGEDRQRRLEPEAARTPRAGAVRLVERSLVDERDPELLRDFLQCRCCFDRVAAALQRTWTRDEREREGIAEPHVPDRHDGIRLGLDGRLDAHRRDHALPARCGQRRAGTRAITPAGSAPPPPRRRRRTAGAARTAGISARDGTARR